jgi:hypothetical protein
MHASDDDLNLILDEIVYNTIFGFAKLISLEENVLNFELV